jgi:ppGpp synthetase/RelA/SpoT-type nucleotidyltranferase
MAVDFELIAKRWEKDEAQYKLLGKKISQFLGKNISELELYPQISFRTKELLSIIKKIQKKQVEKKYDYDSLKDKLGIRIVCTFLEDMDKIDGFLHKHFDIKKS